MPLSFLYLLRQVLRASAGLFHTALVTDSGLLYTCGLGDGGVLGHGDERPALLPRVVAALEHLQVLLATNITLSRSFTCTRD